MGFIYFYLFQLWFAYTNSKYTVKIPNNTHITFIVDTTYLTNSFVVIYQVKYKRTEILWRISGTYNLKNVKVNDVSYIFTFNKTIRRDSYIEEIATLCACWYSIINLRGRYACSGVIFPIINIFKCQIYKDVEVVSSMVWKMWTKNTFDTKNIMKYFSDVLHVYFMQANLRDTR